MKRQLDDLYRQIKIDADLRRAAKHLQGFQTREPRKLENYRIPWPKAMLRLGYVESTLYRSDKDDPLTRPEHLRANDPDGRQGVWKLFEHEHDEGVIVSCKVPPKGGGNWLRTGTAHKSPKQPKTVWWLADLEYLRCQDFAGHEFEMRTEKPMCLWGTVDAKTILLLPKNLANVQEEDVFLVRGGKMRIEPMGIEY